MELRGKLGLADGTAGGRGPRESGSSPLQASLVPVPDPAPGSSPALLRPVSRHNTDQALIHLLASRSARRSPQEVNRRHVRHHPSDGGRRAAAALVMLLPPALYSRLAGEPGAPEPLPVERNPAAGKAPFRFAPRPVRFPRDHEFFEVREKRS